MAVRQHGNNASAADRYLTAATNLYNAVSLRTISLLELLQQCAIAGMQLGMDYLLHQCQEPASLLSGLPS